MRLPLSCLGLVVAPALGGCASTHPYVEPPLNAPHAIVKVHVVHHATPGPQYSGRLLLNDKHVDLPIDPHAPAALGLRVRPEAANWHVGSEFFHMVTRTESYSATESYQCGSTYGARGVSTPQYCTRTVQRTRTVTSKVTDAFCSAVMMHAPVAGSLYVLEYEFTGTKNCSAKCFEQKFGEDGKPTLEPCIGSRSGQE